MASGPVVFFGSGPVAAESLSLLSEHTAIEAVITKPTTLREMSILDSVPVHTISNKQELDELIISAGFTSQLAVLIDFGIIVSQQVIDSFSCGIINSHFSLLPQWRGADPITFSLLSGQPETGVSLMLLSAGMDEGQILSFGIQPLVDKPNAITLTESLIFLSDALLRDAIPKQLVENSPGIDQAEAAELVGISPEPTYSRKLTKADGQIDWTKPAEVLEREIRAYYTWPKSFCTLAGMDVIIRAATIVEQSGQPGNFIADKTSLMIYCGQKALSIDIIQPAGKKEMPIRAFLAGYSSKLTV